MYAKRHRMLRGDKMAKACLENSFKIKTNVKKHLKVDTKKNLKANTKKHLKENLEKRLKAEIMTIINDDLIIEPLKRFFIASIEKGTMDLAEHQKLKEELRIELLNFLNNHPEQFMISVFRAVVGLLLISIAVGLQEKE